MAISLTIHRTAVQVLLGPSFTLLAQNIHDEQMETKYTAGISPAATAEATFQTVAGGPVTVVSESNLVEDRSAIPNAANQVIFKNLPLSWWVHGLNSGSIQYRPVSNDVNWAFVNSAGADVNISTEITHAIIPNRTESASRNPEAKTTTIVMKDNGYLVMTTEMKSPF